MYVNYHEGHEEHEAENIIDSFFRRVLRAFRGLSVVTLNSLLIHVVRSGATVCLPWAYHAGPADVDCTFAGLCTHAGGGRSL